MAAKGTASHGLARNTLAYVLAGGRGARLKQLTDKRAKPAVFFGGNTRIIDFALSNALNSGIRRIAVATQYKAHSLIRHLQQGWNFFRAERNESFDILPASQRVGDRQWYLGTADAVYQNLDIIRSLRCEHVLILAGDHVYKMDYEVMLEEHVARGADVTVACMEVPRTDARSFGVIQVDEGERILRFLEKPADPPALPGRPGVALASMGIYVFGTAFLSEVLRRDAQDPRSAHDFGANVIPDLVPRAKVYAHRFPKSCVLSPGETAAYWRDVGTVDAYWEANLDLARVTPSLNIYDRDWPIWTYAEQGPPAKFVFDDDDRRGMAIDSVVSNGCIVSGGCVRNSLLFTGVHVHSYSELCEAVVLPYAEIGRHARLSRVVIDRGARIPAGLVVGEEPALDAARFHRTEGGVTLITQPMLDRLAGS
jgi:glucose-1-phosphate adenylyltransferase